MTKGFGVSSVHTLSVNKDGDYIDLYTGENMNIIAKKYSLMKFGSVAEINEASDEIYRQFVKNIEEYLPFLEEVKKKGEYIAIAAPGYRNVESASNAIIDKAIKRINIVLSMRELPTIIVVKLPRLESNKANYATLSSDERHSLPPSTDQIMPGREFFQFPIHFIFGDDIKITGATANGAKKATEHFGGKSFSEMYWVALDPMLTSKYPGIEDKINQAHIKDELNEDIKYILDQNDFQPVQRLIRLILNEKNRPRLASFLEKVPDSSLSKLFISAHNNDYPKNILYSESVSILNGEMKVRGLMSEEVI